MLDSIPSPEKPWNERWAVLLRPSVSESTDKGGDEREAPKYKPKMIGIVGTPRKGELAYKINPDYWGKGYMSETLHMFLKMFWESKGLSKLSSFIISARLAF